MSSAAEPAYDFLMHALLGSGARLRDELLDIFLGFAECSNPCHPDASGEFHQRVRRRMQSDKAVFERIYVLHEKPIGDESCGFAEQILEELAD